VNKKENKLIPMTTTNTGVVDDVKKNNKKIKIYFSYFSCMYVN